MPTNDLTFFIGQDPPLIRGNLFSDPHDVAVLVHAIKVSIRLGLSQPFTQFGAEFYNVPLEACSQVQAKLKLYIKIGRVLYHGLYSS